MSRTHFSNQAQQVTRREWLKAFGYHFEHSRDLEFLKDKPVLLCKYNNQRTVGYGLWYRYELTTPREIWESEAYGLRSIPYWKKRSKGASKYERQEKHRKIRREIKEYLTKSDLETVQGEKTRHRL